MAVLTLRGSGVAKTFPIPNGQAVPLDVTDLVFDPTDYTRVRVDVITSRVASAPAAVNINEYSLVITYVNGAWSIVPINYVMSTGNWDGITWSITAAGQVQMVTDILGGTYDVAQSFLTHVVAMKG